MKRALISSVSLAVSLGIIAPAFAYVRQPGFTRTPHREQVQAIKATTDVRTPVRTSSRRIIRDEARNRAVLREMKENTREQSTVTSTRTTHLERTKREYNFRRDNRQPKPGSDRYRALRPNTRYFRRQVEEQSLLPPRVVQTGLYQYDRPTRRDIRGDRNRDVLLEIQMGSQ